jgi:uncharacterized membrane protein YsdA (DUF1294 family)
VQILVVILIVLNVVSFALFGIDKSKARRSARRIPEATLITSGVICGTVGAWIGVYVFRHKTRKPSFLVRLAGASVIDAIVVIALVALF